MTASFCHCGTIVYDVDKILAPIFPAILIGKETWEYTKRLFFHYHLLSDKGILDIYLNFLCSLVKETIYLRHDDKYLGLRKPE